MVQNFYVPDGSKWNEDDIVISGISARLPNCNTVEEFHKSLLAKVDLITDEPRRFQNGLYGAIKRYGLLNDLSKFDAGFFNIHPKQADRMDPQIRNLLEVTFEATLDAGLHPDDLKGTKTGVVVGVASSETQDKWSQMPQRINGYEYSGCTRTMFANRVSYFFDIKGPSYSIDTASSTTLVAFQQAYDMIRNGVCDACFVCGTDLVLNPCVSLMFQCLNMLSPEGKCKAFDISGDGYVRSEGAVAVLLQKAKNAKRVYANVLAAGSNCDGYKDEGITFPSYEMQVKLFSRVAALAGIDPKTIDFMEAHGSATRVGDPQEMNAVTEVFTKGRKGPLRTGSVKSNMGHGEPASAISAVIKICLAMECGILPPNLHYNVPNPDIPALLDGRLKVITEPTPWDGGLVAVNSFGVGGANGHALLLSNKKKKHVVTDNIPRLVCCSGVTESAVHTMVDKIKALPRDPHFYALLNNIHRKNIKGHTYRGFTIMDAENIVNTARTSIKPEQTSLCILLPGLEAHWKSLNPDLLKIQVFRNSIKASEQELKTVMKKIDLTAILLGLEGEESPLNLVIGVAALQIGFITLLRDLDVVSARIVGSNIGEIAAGYAFGAYTLRQAMLLAYRVGNVLQQFYYPSCIVKSDIPPRESNPPIDVSVFVKFHSSCTLFSGPKQSMIKFVKRIKEKKYEVVEVDYFTVDVFGIIRNSGYVSKLESEFKKILVNTNENSGWSAEYLINALSRVTTAIETKITAVKDSVVFEIGPQFEFLDQIPSVACMKDENSVTSFLLSLGQLFNAGFNPQIQNLYPKVEFPVPHGTPMIQSLIEWDHSQNWNVVSFAPKDDRTAGELDIVVDFDKEEFKLLKGNTIFGQETFPRTFYVYLLWKTMSRFQNKPMTDFPLIIENIFFIREILLPEDDSLKFSIIILEVSRKFEIRESGHAVVTGEVRIPGLETLSKERIPANLFTYDSSTTATEIGTDDVYRYLNINEYQYNNAFKSIKSFNYGDNSSTVRTDTWLTYLEAFVQISILNSVFEVDATRVVSFIRKIVIDPQKNQKDEVPVHYNKKLNALKSIDIEIRGIEVKPKHIVQQIKPSVVCSKFVPFIADKIDYAAEISVTLALDNFVGCNDLKIAEIINNSTELRLTTLVKNSNPFLRVDSIIYCNDSSGGSMKTQEENVKFLCKSINIEPITDANFHIVMAKNIIHSPEAFKNLIKSIRTNGCLVLEENVDGLLNYQENVELIAQIASINKVYYVLKKINSKIRNSPRVIVISSLLDCLQKLQHIPDDNQGLLIVAMRSFNVGGIIPFMKSISAHTQTTNLRVMLIEDENAPVFSLANPIYAEQLQRSYPLNVYKNGVWGTYTTSPFHQDSNKDTQETSRTSLDSVAANSKIDKCGLNTKKNTVCQALYAAVNMVDYQGTSARAFSSLSPSGQNRCLCLEFAGYEGTRRVFGLVSKSTVERSVIADEEFLWTIPENWSFEEAATIPYAYAISFYSLKIRGGIQTGSSVLIIGINSVAIAAIYIAIRHDCDIFILLEDGSQTPLLRKLFPQISDENLIVSEGNDFHLRVLQRTSGKGVKLLFDTLPVKDYDFQSRIRSLAENGVCVYFNHDHHTEEILGSSGNMKCLTFHRISPLCLFDSETSTVKQQVSKFVADGLNEEYLQPLPYLVFSDKNTTDIYSTAVEKNMISKAIIKIEHDTQKVSKRDKFHLDDSKSYIILAGKTDFGVYTAIDLIAQGVRNLILIDIATSNRNSQLFNFLLQRVEENDKCEISKITMNDFSVRSCESILQKATKNISLGGIFDFTQFEIEAPETINFSNGSDLKTIVDQKIAFLSNMDTATRKLVPSLPYFVSFSLIELDYGLPDCSILSYANGMIQNIMRGRNESGLNGTLIQWGKVGESVEDILFNKLETPQAALPPQSIRSCLQTLHQLLESSEPVLSSFITNEFVETTADSKVDVIVEGVAKFLGIKNPDSVLPTLTMLDLGLDSLIGTDIQQFLEINYGVTLSTQEVRELTFEKIRKLAENL